MTCARALAVLLLAAAAPAGAECVPNPESQDPTASDCPNNAVKSSCLGDKGPNADGVKVTKCLWVNDLKGLSGDKSAQAEEPVKRKKRASPKTNKSKYFSTVPPETPAYRWGPDGKPIMQKGRKKGE